MMGGNLLLLYCKLCWRTRTVITCEQSVADERVRRRTSLLSARMFLAWCRSASGAWCDLAVGSFWGLGPFIPPC
jgi:hypothetical protein